MVLWFSSGNLIFEYALLKKPILFFCYDLKAYNRGFYLKYPEDLPGDVVQTQQELEDFLNSSKVQQADARLAQFAARYMSACDGGSSRRIADIINGYMS